MKKKEEEEEKNNEKEEEKGKKQLNVTERAGGIVNFRNVI